MAIDERRRHELYLRAEEVLGPEPATTLMEHLPPAGWADVATKGDLVALRQGTEALRQEMAAEFKAVRQETAARFDLVDVEFRLVREEIKSSRLEVIAALHTEFMAQTKAMFLAIVSIVLTMSGLVFALAR